MLPFFPLNHPLPKYSFEMSTKDFTQGLEGEGVTEQLREMERARIEAKG